MKEKNNSFFNEKTYSEVFTALLSIIGGISFCYVFNLAGFAAQKDSFGFSQSIFSIFPFLIIWFFLRRIKYNKRQLVFSLIFGSLVGLSIVLGYQLRILGYTTPGFKNKFLDLILAIGLGIGFLPLSLSWFKLLDVSNERKEVSKDKPSRKERLIVFGCSFAALMVLWFPVFLAYYPAVMSYDFNRQSGEAIRGTEFFWAHHPIVHTYLIRIFLIIGEKLGSHEIGMALFSICQMLFVSAVLAFSFSIIYEITGKKRWVIILSAFFGLVPFSPVLSISITKDVPYAALLLLFLLLLYKWKTAENLKGKILFALLLVLCGIPGIWLRNNAVYAFAVMIPVWFILEKGIKHKLAITAVSIAVLLGGIGGKALIQKGFHSIPETGKIEMLSVPMMQMARVIVRRPDDMSEDTRETLLKYFNEIDVEGYNESIADSVRGKTYGFDKPDSITGLVKDWIKLGVRYPNEYIDAYLALTAGYWSLDDFTHAEMLGYGDTPAHFGLLYTFPAADTELLSDLKQDSKIPALYNLYDGIVSQNGYYAWPALSNIMKPAVYCWMFVLLIFSAIYVKCKRRFIYILYPLLFMLTVLLGPTAIFRYVYPMLLTLPFLFAEVLFDDGLIKGKEETEKVIEEKADDLAEDGDIPKEKQEIQETNL